MPKSTKRVAIVLDDQEYEAYEHMAKRLTAGNMSAMLKRAAAVLAFQESIELIKAS